MGSWAGYVLASKAIELDRERFRKLRGETVTEFVRNSKGLVAVANAIRKKRHAKPKASASIQASI